MQRHSAIWLCLVACCFQWAAIASTAELAPVGADSAALACDFLTNRIAPYAADEAASRVYYFRADSSPAARQNGVQLALTCDIHLGQPGDSVVCSFAPDGLSPDDATTVETIAFQNGPHRFDLSPLWHGEAGCLKLTLQSRRPAGLWVKPLAWELNGLIPAHPADGWLPPTAWLQPAFAALADGRAAVGLPPRAWPTAGLGRVTLRPVASWTKTLDGWSAGPWDTGLGQSGYHLLWLAGGAQGAKLTLGGVELANELPDMPLGLALDRPLGDAMAPDATTTPTAQLPPESAGPSLLVGGAAEPQLRLLTVGPLQIRYQRATLAAGSLRVETVVVNHTDAPYVGQIGCVWTLANGAQRFARSGYQFPVGPSVATLILPATSGDQGDARTVVDDGATVSDIAEGRLIAREITVSVQGLTINGRVMAVCKTLKEAEAARGTSCWQTAAPADPAALAEAERLDVPVWLTTPTERGDLLASEQILARNTLDNARPAVVWVSRRP